MIPICYMLFNLRYLLLRLRLIKNVCLPAASTQLGTTGVRALQRPGHTRAPYPLAKNIPGPNQSYLGRHLGGKELRKLRPRLRTNKQQ